MLNASTGLTYLLKVNEYCIIIGSSPNQLAIKQVIVV